MKTRLWIIIGIAGLGALLFFRIFYFPFVVDVGA